MKKIKIQKIFIIAGIFFILGFLVSQSLFQIKKPQNFDEHSFQLFWRVWNLLEEKYPFEKPKSIDKTYGAIEGLIASYHDDYSHFFPPKSSKQFTEDIHGEFGGIGVEIAQRQGFLIAIAPLKDSPAEKAGMLAGDIITHIEGENIYGKEIDDIISKIRGKIGTIVTVTVARADKDGNLKTIKLKIKREIIKVPVLDTQEIEDVFVISLYNFNENSAEDFKKAIKKFKKSKTQKLLIDLRNNPGGYLNQAIDMLSYFLPKNDLLVEESFGASNKEKKLHRSKGFQGLTGKKYIMAVLINKGSASASEIFAGALQDYKKATIIGETSYGKGSVQEFIDLDYGTSIKITVAKWLTPKGHQISKKGIVPDIPFKNLEDMSLKDIVQKWERS